MSEDHTSSAQIFSLCKNIPGRGTAIAATYQPLNIFMVWVKNKSYMYERTNFQRPVNSADL